MPLSRRSFAATAATLAAGAASAPAVRALEHATAAFMFNGVLCQVPDLDAFQKKIAASQKAA